MPGIADLVNNIQGSIEALAADLGIIQPRAKGSTYPSFPDLQSDVQSLRANWRKSLPYSFAVQSLSNPSNLQPFDEFVLPLNPTDLSQDETFAISVRPTQGGTVTQHAGNKYKDLVIAGTTGVAPFRGAGGVAKSTGKAILQPDDLKHRSGYEVFLSLRNWFKAYYQYKNNNHDPRAKDAHLVFRNYKDGEFLLIEVLKFSLKRSSTRPFLYDYVITCKVKGHVTFRPNPKDTSILGTIDSVLDDALEKLDTARGIFLRSQNILRQVESTYENSVLEPLRKTTLTVKALLGTGTVAADMGKQVVSSTVSALAGLGIMKNIQSNLGTLGASPADTKLVNNIASRAAAASALKGSADASAVNGLKRLFDTTDLLLKVDSGIFPQASVEAVSADQALALELPRSFYEESIASLIRVRDNASDKFNLGNATYNQQEQRTPTLVAESSRVATDQEYELLYGFNQAILGLDRFLSSNVAFKNSFEDRINNVEASFNDSLPITAEKAMIEVPLDAGTDLEHLALKYLGDSARWVEIAELNDLKPPYIVQDISDTTESVLHPGEIILIPAPIVNGFGTTPDAKPLPITDSLSAVEKNLGVDLKLTKDFDLELTNSNDLQLAIAAENAAQAIILKLTLEKGDLLKHPELGVGLAPGSKFPSLGEIRVRIVQTLTQDPRFDRVENLELIQDNSSLHLSMEVFLKQVDIPVRVRLKL